MSELFSELGISLPSLLAQGLNFLVVLVVLSVFVYRPLGKIVDERRRRIEEGLEHGRQADLRLAQIGEKEKDILTQAERTALATVKEAEGKAIERSRVLVEEGERRAEAAVKEGKTLAKRQAAEGMVTLEKEAISFIKQAISKTVELEPKFVDERLIEEAVKSLRRVKA